MMIKGNRLERFENSFRDLEDEIAIMAGEGRHPDRQERVVSLLDRLLGRGAAPDRLAA
jgi:hypothetical protein